MVWVSSADYGNAEQKVSDVGITYSGGSVPEGTYGSYGNNNRGPLTLLDQLKTDTEGWQTDVIPSSDTYSPNNGFEWTIDYSSNGYKARLITAEEIAEITKNDRSGDNYSISSSPEEPWTLQSGSFLLDKQTADCFNDDNCDTTGTISKYWWLFDNTSGCTSYGCKTADSGTNGYWTSSPSAGISYYAWYVHYFGRLDGNYVYGGYDYGVRPVITVSKSKFLQE